MATDNENEDGTGSDLSSYTEDTDHEFSDQELLYNITGVKHNVRQKLDPTKAVPSGSSQKKRNTGSASSQKKRNTDQTNEVPLGASSRKKQKTGHENEARSASSQKKQITGVQGAEQSALRRPETQSTSRLPCQPHCQENFSSMMKEMMILKTNQEKIIKLIAEQKSETSCATKKKTKLYVPGYVRVAVHDGFKSAKDSDNLEWHFSGANTQTHFKHDSRCNQEMSQHIEDFVLGLYGAVDRGVIKSAIGRYYISVRDDQQRLASGKTDQHKRKMAGIECRKRKLKRRETALLKKHSYTDELKGQIKSLLTIDFMSSESEVESDNEEFFAIKKLAWRSDNANKFFSELDKKAEETMTSRSKKQRVRRVRGDRLSLRSVAQVSDEQNWGVQEN